MGKMQFIKDVEYDYDDDNILLCPICGCPNSHISGYKVNDNRVPYSKHGNYTIEISCEYKPEHKWIISAIEHKGSTWLIEAIV